MKLDTDDPRTHNNLEEALDALRMRVAWYTSRRHPIPSGLAAAFDALADALAKPDERPWHRIRRPV